MFLCYFCNMNKYLTIIMAIVTMLVCSSCDKEKNEPERKKQSRTVLIYAVASNNLSSYLDKDKEEMIVAAPSVAGLGDNVRVLLYSVASKNASEASIAELSVNHDGSYDFKTLKSYSRETFSTDPKRMSEVFADLRQIAPADKFGLIFWSHGTGWLPDFNTHELPGLQRSFGWDTYRDTTDKCDVIELADAIPDRLFDYIWFDACYMMCVENVYQLRNKCEYIGGYPTEDWSPGMNYDTTLPLLAAVEPDLQAAGKVFFDYYNASNLAVTVSVIATDGLEGLAAVSSEIYSLGTRPESAFGFQDYGRSPYRGLYDFGQFTRAYLSGNDDSAKIQLQAADSLNSAFTRALGEVLLYGGCTSKDFYGNSNAFDPNIYSGMSCHFPDTFSQAQEDYYRRLDWYQATKP